MTNEIKAFFANDHMPNADDLLIIEFLKDVVIFHLDSSFQRVEPSFKRCYMKTQLLSSGKWSSEQKMSL